MVWVKTVKTEKPGLTLFSLDKFDSFFSTPCGLTMLSRWTVMYIRINFIPL
jgi:hypothetical protein